MNLKTTLMSCVKKYGFILSGLVLLIALSSYLFLMDKSTDADDLSEPLSEEGQAVVAAVDMMKERMVSPENGEFDTYADHEIWQMDNSEGTWVVNGHFIRNKERAAYEVRLYRYGSEWVMVEITFPFDWEERTAS